MDRGSHRCRTPGPSQGIEGHGDGVQDAGSDGLGPATGEWDSVFWGHGVLR